MHVEERAGDVHKLRPAGVEPTAGRKAKPETGRGLGTEWSITITYKNNEGVAKEILPTKQIPVQRNTRKNVTEMNKSSAACITSDKEGGI